MLTEQQIEFFHANGYLVVENAVSAEQLDALRADFGGWVEESRQHQDGWGETVNGKARFDVEKGHNADKPALRRINAPHEVSDAFFNVMSDSAMTDMVADLIGPDVKLHHTKVNSKLPARRRRSNGIRISLHPAYNDDLITALLMVDEVTEENGPLEVWAGTHTGEIHTLWHDGKFTGAVDEDVTEEALKKRTICTARPAASAYAHAALHGSAPNNSDAPRTLFICVYSAADAMPVSPSPVPTRNQGRIVRGEDRGRVRSSGFDIPMPELPRAHPSSTSSRHPDRHHVAA